MSFAASIGGTATTTSERPCTPDSRPRYWVRKSAPVPATGSAPPRGGLPHHAPRHTRCTTHRTSGSAGARLIDVLDGSGDGVRCSGPRAIRRTRAAVLPRWHRYLAGAGCDHVRRRAFARSRMIASALEAAKMAMSWRISHGSFRLTIANRLLTGRAP